MSELQEFKCPNCESSITFDSNLQKMKCPYCDAEFAVASLRSYLNDSQEPKQDDMNWGNDSGTWQEDELSGLRAYVCHSCGGEILTGEHTVATSCPFCDNPVVMKELVAGDWRPAAVIPFILDKEAAKTALREHYGGKRFLPKAFKNENHIDEIQGIYVPFWFFDADANTSITYHTTRDECWSDSTYHYTRTKHYRVIRKGTVRFRNVPVDGSSKLDDRLMESIEPFRMEGAVNFETAYLAGYLADKYDVNREYTRVRANARIKTSALKSLRSDLYGYTTSEEVSAVVQMENSRFRYVLCPVWLLNTTWREKKYTFAMNGQTGKLAGDLPEDRISKLLMFLCAFGIAGIACFALCCLLWLMW